LADKGYDADALRRQLRQNGTVPVIPGRANRKKPIPLDKARYRERHYVENAFCRIKDFRRVATRYDKLANNFLSAVALAVILAFWI
jgi:transposase